MKFCPKAAQQARAVQGAAHQMDMSMQSDAQTDNDGRQTDDDPWLPDDELWLPDDELWLPDDELWLPEELADSLDVPDFTLIDGAHLNLPRPAH